MVVDYIYFLGEQNTDNTVVRELFKSFDGGIHMGYDSSGLEWGYIFFKRSDNAYGSIVRVSSHGNGIQIMYYQDGAFTEWANI